MKNIIWMWVFVLIGAGAKGQNVGIGTELPNGLLHLHGGSNTNTNLIFSNNVSGQNSLNNNMMVSFSRSANIANSYGQIYVPQDIRFWIRQGDNYPFYIAGNGAVGIGASNPTARLQVAGGSAIIENTLNNSSYLYIRSGSNNGLYLETTSDGTNTISKIRPISGGGAGRGITLRSNSYVGMGTLDVPMYPLHVHATSDALSTSGIAFTHSAYGENPDNGMKVGMRVGDTEAEQYSFIQVRNLSPFYFFQGNNARLSVGTNGNVAIGNHIPHASAALDIEAPNRGVLIPRLTEVQRNAIVNPATGLLVYNNSGSGDFSYYNGSRWIDMSTQLQLITQNNKSGWRLRVISPSNYGNIGAGAVDFSQSNGPSTTRGATGDGSFAAGNNSTASGPMSIAFGSGSFASGESSMAFGRLSTASSLGATAIGFNSTASGSYAFVAGNSNTASGQSSSAFGDNTVASGLGTFVIGRYNDFVNVPTTDWSLTAPLFIIGNGTASHDRRSALTVLKNGNTGIGIANPLSPLHVSSRLVIERPTGGAAPSASLEWRSDGAYRGGMGWDVNAARFFFYDGKSNTNTMFINNGRIGIQRDPTTNALEINGNASKTTAGDWLANSDERLKKNIASIQNPLAKLLQLRGITYEWNDDKTGMERPTGEQMGFTAQNIQQVFPQLVTPDAQGFLQTAYGTYDALYVEAIRELLEKVALLEDRIKVLETRK